jgi:polar amino acid transport system substrate-binding protein
LLPRQFVAITLAKSDLQINTLEDLAGKKVAFHPSLLTTLGPELEQIEAISSSAESVSNHELLAMFLYSGRIDVLISERSVFDYHLRQISPQVDTDQPIVFHNIFPVQYPRLLFQDKQLRDEFDMAWHELLQQQNIAVMSPAGAYVQDQKNNDESSTP